MAVQNPKELFLYELSCLYHKEQEGLKALSQLAQECDDQMVKSTVQEHEQETRQQIQNIEQCFRICNAQPQQIEDPVMMAMKKKHDAFMQQNPSKEMVKMWAIDHGVVHEHAEIAAYKTLMGQAIHLGEIRVVDLLEQNYVQEAAMASKLTKLAYKMGEQMAHARP
jgi:ferritin-like metal-binding protein YciE